MREEKLKIIRDKLKDKMIRTRRRRKLFETEEEKEERIKET